MEDLKCTLCDNRCALTALGCRKGRRFYEAEDTPFCTLCENHCELSSLSCYKGKSFYNGAEDDSLSDGSATTEDVMKLMEHAGHYLFHRRGGKAGQLRILRYLSHHENLTQRHLQAKLELSSGSMSEIVAKLESQGFLIRTTDPEDKRQKVLNITEEGRQALRNMRAEDQRIGLFDCLSEAQRNSLASILETLLENWRNAQ